MATYRAAPRVPVAFDEILWKEDLARVPAPERAHALAARRRIETAGGLPLARPHVYACAEDHRDGTSLPGCVKHYTSGRFGIVFELVREVPGGRVKLELRAVGDRHPHARHMPSVYQLAHERLHRS